MLVTILIESALLVYTVWRYKLTQLTRLVALAVAALAVFQICEYRVCAGFGPDDVAWSRLGYIAITLLPPLGLHIMHLLAGKPGRRLVLTAYATMTAFVVYFLVYSEAFVGYQCTGNYVIYQIGDRPASAYGIYYYGWLFTAMGLGIKWASQALKRGKSDRSKLHTIRALIVGYLVFLVPTALVNSINPESRRGIPSIMCGFAILFALILVLYILPRAAQRRKVK